jgi:subtilisin-like proprotein convertase family protein
VVHVDLEGLERRALMATIPAAAATGSIQNLSAMMGNIGGVNASMNSSQVVVDPHDPSKMVAVWQDNDPTMAAVTLNGFVVAVEAAYSVDSGQTWLPLFAEPTNTAGLPTQPFLLNPATSGPTVPYAYQTNPNVGFDNSDNFYILTEYSSGGAAGAAASSGALVLQKYNFSGSTPTTNPQGTPPNTPSFPNNEQDPSLYGGFFGGGFGSTSDLKVIYQWLSSGNNDAVIDPTMTVDDNQATLPPSVSSQVDPNSGNVYVSWTSVDIPVYQNPLGPDFNPYRIKTVVSSDGGNNFGPITISDVNTQNGNDVNGQQGAGNGPAAAGTMRDFNPAMTVSQGRAPSESGLSGDPGITGGQVTVSWDNAGPNTLMANTLTPGHDSSFGQQPDHFIPVQSIDTQDFKIPVSLSNITDLDSLDARVDIVDPSDQYLGLTLIAPNGQQFVLQFAGTFTGGANEGVQTYTNNNIAEYELGTIFDDNATRVIGDKSEAAPYAGDYVPEDEVINTNGTFAFETLNQFVKNLGSSVNGTWTLETTDTNTSTSATPGTVLDWSLSFGRGLTPDNDVPIPSNGLVVPISSATGLPTTSVPASPIPIGPGVVMAVDNTLGPNSPFEGRIYAAFVGYQNITVDGIKNPAANTDIYLTFSDDGGRTWSTPAEVNDDNSDVNGLSGASESFLNPDVYTGRTQFQPALAVDPATGTLVASWRDASNDPTNTLVATYLASSIDGGATFSAESYANPSLTATDAVDTQTKVALGPEADNGTAANTANSAEGFGSSMGLAVYNGQVYPLWTGNLDEASNVNNVPVLNALSTFFRPMVIAAGPRIVNSTMGPIPYAEAQSGSVTFTVTFDRPINPPNSGALSTSFNPSDVQVFYHDTSASGSSIPLDVLSVTPVASSGVGPNNKFGFTEFTVSFDPSKAPGGGSSNIADFTGTYSYLIAPDDGAGTPIVAPVDSFVVSPVAQPTVGPIASTQVPLPIPSSGTGGTGTADDFTTSFLNIGNHVNQVITGVTVNLSLTHQNGADLFITLTAPDGQTGVVFQGTVNGPLTLSNAAFLVPVNQIAGGPVDGTYTLTIDDTQTNNVGTLTGWSVTVDSELPTLGLQVGAPMDQNADGTPDENPMTMTGGYTGTTPGDVYAVPTPQLTASVTFTNALSILSPPFNQNTLPLIVPGPQIVSTQAVGTSGQLSSGTGNLLNNDTTGQFQVTFDRPVQTSSFTASQVLSIMGPVGPITGVQSYSPTAVDQSFSPATSAGPGTLSSTITINSGGTLTIQDLTVSLSIASSADAGLSAVLIAPDGTTQIPLFAASDLSGANLVNTVFSDSGATAITQGSAPYTATYVPDYGSSLNTLSSLAGQSADGTWTLQLTNTRTGVIPTLDTWSLNITPTITVMPVAPTTVTIGGVQEQVATTFTIGFPQQQLSGTYTIQLGPGIQSQFGDATDVSQSAGLNVLRGVQQNGPTTTVRYTAADTPKTILPSTQTDNSTGLPIPGTVSSSIVVPDSFIIEGDKTAAGQSVMQVQLNIAYPNDPDLTATLYHYGPTGTLMGQVVLFSNVGQGTRTANFTNTVLDDNAATPIQEGSAPFFAVYDPQQSLANVFAPTTGGQQGMNVQGTWTLVVTDSSTTGTTGAINSWSLTFQKPLPTSGLGVQGSGPSVSFRLSNLGASNPLASQAWSPVGGASSTFESGQVNAIAVDPSDPTGNTVYVGGASGGVWKTTDFLTTNPAGPTWIPLTNFGPNSAINISSIAVFARNHNPNQSIIIAATGGFTSGQQGTDAPGVGFLISQDGGVTWNLYDSTVNVSGAYTQTSGSGDLLPINSTARDRLFVGTTAYQLAVDPQLSPTGQVIIYAALSGTNGGIWRSENTGQTWTQVLAGNATAIVLNQDSGISLDPVTGTDVQGNLQIAYAGIEGQGVYMSTNQGQSWTLMNGGVGNPLIVDTYDGKNDNPGNPTGPDTATTPNGAEGRIVLAVPSPTGNALQDEIYAGWLYAAVATSTGGFDGLFVTKDFGENWTDIQLPTLPPEGPFNQAVPTDSATGTDGAGTVNYPITDDNQGNLDLALTVDPTNPNITYLGGFGGNGYNSDTGLIRVDATQIADAHSLVALNDQSPGKALTLNGTLGYTTADNVLVQPVWEDPDGAFDPTAYLNFIRDPLAPFLTDSTLYVNNYASFTNSGLKAAWTPMDVPVSSAFTPPGGNNEISGTGYQILLAEVDPTTGLPRILAGNFTGIYSGLDNQGVFEATIGSSDAVPSINRNGDLQLGQYYYAAAQPSSAAAQAAQALFYAGAQNIGGQAADPNLLTDGNITWSAIGEGLSSYSPTASSDVLGGTFYIASGTAVDQQGTGTLYQFFSPGQGGEYTNFVMVNGIGRTFNLLQQSNGLPTPDPQWGETSYASIVVDPVNGQDLILSSSTGNIFASTDQGKTWFDIGEPATFGLPASTTDDGDTSFALAYGAPDPNAPQGLGNLGNFMYVGTSAGQAYVSQNAGGNWLNISLGLDGTAVKQIITDPARGSHDAYAVTADGVFYLADSVLLGQNPANTRYEWVNITGDLKAQAYSIFGQSYDPTTDQNATTYNLATVLNSIAANWNYVIPNDPADLSQGYHPVLYVAANSGVYMSTDQGQSWVLYPSTTYGATVAGGDLPHVNVTDLSLSQGNISVASGMPDLAGPFNPDNPHPAVTVTGILTTGSAVVTGVSSTTDLLVGDIVTGTGIPADTSIISIDSASSITLSAGAAQGGTNVSLTATDPADPDLLLAATYGEGAFAINLAPMILNGASPTQVDSADVGGATVDGTPIVTTAAPTIDGLSEITGFGNATWVTIVDETTADTATFGQVIGGFNPASVAFGQAMSANASNSTDIFGNFKIPLSTAFSSNGLKTIEVFVTDDAGAKSVPVTLTFMLNANDLSHPNPTQPPGQPSLELTPTTPPYAIVNSLPVTNNTAPLLDGSAAAGPDGTSITVTELWTNPTPNAPQTTITFTLPASDITAAGASEDFSFPFQDFLDSSGNAVNNGIFEVSVTATYNPFPGITGPASQPSVASNPVTFQIDNTSPTPVADLRLNPANDTGIVGDDVTADRTPQFIGSTAPGYTVELFVNGQSAPQATATAIPGFTGTLTLGSATITDLSGTTGLAIGQLITGTGIPAGTTIASINATAGTLTLTAAATATASGEALTAMYVDDQGNTYNFAIQLPYSLTNGETSLFVEVVDLAGNTSAASNVVGVSISSIAADYNGGPASDPALFAPVASSNQVQWGAQTPTGSSPWFGASGVPYIPSANFTGVLTAGSSIVTGIVSTKGLAVGDNVTGVGIPAGATIQAINSSSSITLSAAATAAGLNSLAATVPANEVVPFDGDFDGDGVSDLVYYNLATATWTLFESSNAAVQGPTTFSMGTPGASLPVVGHFDANGPSEEAVFTINAQGNGVWTVASVLSGNHVFGLGTAGDIPLAGDFDAIGYDEAAVYRPSTGQFFVDNPITNQVETFTIPGLSSSADLASMVPVPGQYDNLAYYQQAIANHQTPPISGRTEPAVFDTKTGVYTILGPGGNAYTVSGFQPGDIPAPADYLGDGSDQVVAFRPGTGQFIEGSTGGQTTTLATIGGPGDIPVTAPLAYRLPNPTDSQGSGGGSTTGGGTSGGGSTTGGGTSGGGSTTGGGSSGGSTTGGSTTGGSTGGSTTGGGSGSTSVSPTTTPTSTPLVTVSNVQMITNKQHKVTEILVSFSGAVNASEAQTLGEYSLVLAGKGGSFTARNATKLKLKAASYDAADSTVALIPKKPFATSKKVQLEVGGLRPSGLQDSLGRTIVGSAGGAVTAVLSRQGVSMAVPAVSGGTPSNATSAVDALLELNALADVTPAGSGGRKRR